MIQRIQSIYLFLSALCSSALLFLLPVFTLGEELKMPLAYPTFFSLYMASTALAIFSIFRFKNRQQQVVLGRINVIINFVLFGIILYTYFEAIKPSEGSLGLASFIPIICVVLLSVANRAIMSDEALVKAADRFR